MNPDPKYVARFLFTGREWLSDLRIYDYRNRHYQPQLGRFLQPDPKQFEAGDYNLYRYCHNDPINQVDPTGEAPPVLFAALVAARIILVNAAIGAGVDLGVQLARNGGDFSKINTTELKVAAVSGAFGGALGRMATNAVAQAGLKGVPAIAARFGINASGNGAFGASTQIAQNVANGEPVSNNVVAAALNSAAWGGGGSLATDGASALLGSTVPAQSAANALGTVSSNFETPTNYVERREELFR